MGPRRQLRFVKRRGRVLQLVGRTYRSRATIDAAVQFHTTELAAVQPAPCARELSLANRSPEP